MTNEEAIGVLKREQEKMHWNSLDDLKQASEAWRMAIEALKEQSKHEQNTMLKQPNPNTLGIKTDETCADAISRRDAIDVILADKIVGKALIVMNALGDGRLALTLNDACDRHIRDIEQLPSVQSEIIRCKDCKHWRQQTNYQGAPLSFGFCESDNMWRSLYGETTEVSHIVTDDDFYCGYAERRIDDER